MSAPIWTTPAGFLGTVTERVTTSTLVQASGVDISYSIISGSLPGGLRFSNTGTIAGTPYSIGQTIRSQFVVRASNTIGITDRTFFIDTDGPTAPTWLTPSGMLPIGIASQFYAVNKQFVDYQMSAEYDRLPPGQKLRYFVEDNDGEFPPGLELTEDGRIVGQINDKLKLTYKAASFAGYDLEPYDVYPYDHVTLVGTQLGTTARFIARTYQFYVSVTDGVATSKQLFKIKVEDAGSLRVDNTFINVDTEQYLTDAGYLLSPQWLTPANLGVVRANNKHIIKLDVYDFNPFYGPTRYDWTTPTVNQDGTPSVHPPNFELDTSSGALYATLPYQPAYSLSYTFTVWVIKKDIQTLEETATARTFTLTVKGDVESVIEWVSGNNIGTLAPGEISELYIKARHIGSNFDIQYRLTDGNLPSGLTLRPDGSLSGQIDYDTQIYFDRASYGFNSFTLDGGSTTIDRNYTFTVLAVDIYGSSAIEKEFTLTISENSIVKYTKIYSEPLLPRDQRLSYQRFVNDSFTFDRSMIYRLEDPNFGLQQKIQLYFEHGIEQTKLANYRDALRDYFYRKQFYFGEVKYSKAEDRDGNYVYDLVYVEVIDPLGTGDNLGLVGSAEFGSVTAYPNSVANMRDQLQSIQLEGETIKTDEYLQPRYMRTIQEATGNPLGFILAVPLCYAVPGKGDTIVKRIKLTDFDFKEIHFEIDRLLVKNNLTESGAKYLLFPRKDIIGTNLGEELSYIQGPEEFGLFTEDGYPLYVEL